MPKDDSVFRDYEYLFPIEFDDNLFPPYVLKSRDVLYQRCVKYLDNLPKMCEDKSLRIRYQVMNFIFVEYKKNRKLGSYLDQLYSYPAYVISKEIIKASYYNI